MFFCIQVHPLITVILTGTAMYKYTESIAVHIESKGKHIYDTELMSARNRLEVVGNIYQKSKLVR